MKVTANATRTGDWWAVEVPEVPGVFTQAKRLDQVAEMVRDAVALMADVPEDSVEVEVVPAVDEAVSRALAAVEAKREQAEALAREATESVTALARTLTEESGMSLRDAGVVLGISHQRVAQLLNPKGSLSTKKSPAPTRAAQHLSHHGPHGQSKTAIAKNGRRAKSKTMAGRYTPSKEAAAKK